METAGPPVPMTCISISTKQDGQLLLHTNKSIATEHHTLLDAYVTVSRQAKKRQAAYLQILVVCCFPLY